MLTQDEYLAKSGNVCPCCGLYNITGHAIDVDGRTAAQEVECLECGASWYDEYTLTGYTLTGHTLIEQAEKEKQDD